MKALGKAKPEPGIWMLDWPDPEPGPNDVLIRVRKTAICGTDLHISHWDEWARGTSKVPMPVGHEFCGVIEEVGREVRGFRKGLGPGWPGPGRLQVPGVRRRPGSALPSTGRRACGTR